MQVMIDLHMHSWYSEDGEYLPEELVEKCDEKGICVLSITDHSAVITHLNKSDT